MARRRRPETQHEVRQEPVERVAGDVGPAAQQALFQLHCQGVRVVPRQSGDCPVGTVPMFADAAMIADVSLEVGEELMAVELPMAMDGDGDIVYSISPMLPAGLMFDDETRMLSGTPAGTADDDSGMTDYTYAATDGDGDRDALEFTITITDAMPSFGDAKVTPQMYYVGEQGMLDLPMAMGGSGDLMHSIDPALPEGLMLDDMMRISGTPTMAQATMMYTWTAKDIDGDSASVEFAITIAIAPIRVQGFTMPDAGLRQAIADELGETGANIVITAEELAGLKRLDASKSGILDLTGLEGAASLMWLDLRRNMISDLMPLAGLMHLERLSVSSNMVSDLMSLSGLMKLRLLYLSSNVISDLKPLSGLMSLKRLHLSSNMVEDVMPLGMLDLTELRLSDNMVMDIGSLSSQMHMTRLYLNDNKIMDISALQDLMHLERVRLDGNPLNAAAAMVIDDLKMRGVRVKADD